MDVIKKINEASSIWEILPQLTIDELERAIAMASEAYHSRYISLISDADYDVLVEKLKKRKPQSKVLKQIGAPITGEKTKLPYWMGSMNKIKSDEDAIQKWEGKYEGPYVISDKLDGISCLLNMVDGQIFLYTRGDGAMGKDITHLLHFIEISVEKLKEKTKNATIRGELIMTKENFQKYKDVYANARNMVGGIVNSKPKTIDKKQATDIEFVTYEVIEPRMKPSEQLKQLKKWGLDVVHWDIYSDVDLNIIMDILEKRRKKSPYEIDGIIVTEDKKHAYIKAGNPDYSFAYKGLTEMVNTKVLGVIWTPSKDGILAPTIVYEKVILPKATLTKATGFNAKYILDNQIGKGAIITVTHSSDTIPYVADVVKSAKEPSLPKNLDYTWDKNEVQFVLKHPEQNETVIIKRLTKFMREIGVDNLSEGIVTRLVRTGYGNIPKIISLTKNDFLELEGFQETLATKLYQNLRKSLDNLDMLTLMSASNIFGRGFGEKKLRKILDAYPQIVDEYRLSDKKTWREKLISLEGFEQITTDAFLDALPDFQKFHQKINKTVTIKPYFKKIKKDGLFKNEIVVFTGFRNKNWQKFVEDEGGKITGSVSGKTTLLIYNDGEESSAKYQKAKQLGIKTIAKSVFAKKYNL